MLINKRIFGFLFLFASGMANAEFTDREAQLVRDLVEFCDYQLALAPAILKSKEAGLPKEESLSASPALRTVINVAYDLDASSKNMKMYLDTVRNRCFEDGLKSLLRGEIK